MPAPALPVPFPSAATVSPPPNGQPWVVNEVRGPWPRIVANGTWRLLAAKDQQRIDQLAAAKRDTLLRLAGRFHAAAADFARYLDRTAAADWPGSEDVIERELPRLPDTDEGSETDTNPGGGRW